jgi:hypothetical protein
MLVGCGHGGIRKTDIAWDVLEELDAVYRFDYSLEDLGPYGMGDDV